MSKILWISISYGVCVSCYTELILFSTALGSCQDD